jgi:tripartite-type tricarboxylate transporter receptor subunit TctC
MLPSIITLVMRLQRRDMRSNTSSIPCSVTSRCSMRAWLDKQGMVAVGGSPDDFKRQIESDYQTRGELVRTLGITGE